VSDLAAALRAEVDRAALVFRSWGDSDVVRSRGVDKWTRKQDLGHLVDSAANNHQRFVRARFTSPFVWPGYDQLEWVSLHRYSERPWDELVDLWVALNRQVAAAVDSLPAEKLQTTCVIGQEKPAPLEWWVEDYLRHMKHHLEQIERE
jgi:hypothetical protein